MGEVVVKVIERAERGDIVRLYTQAGWWKSEYSRDTSFIDGVVADSFCFVGAFHGGRMVGMGRSISDGVSDAYIQDVTVEKEFRGGGIGGMIINTLTRFIRARGIDWVGLIAEPGSHTFYERLGFSVMKDYVPMLFRGDEDKS